VKLDEEITTYWTHLHKDPSTLEDLKFVLETISNIHARSMDTELRYRDIRERYRTLVTLYKLPVPEDEGIVNMQSFMPTIFCIPLV